MKIAKTYIITCLILGFAYSSYADEKNLRSANGIISGGATPSPSVQQKADATGVVNIGKGINMTPVRGRINTSIDVNISQDGRIVALNAELNAPFDIPADAENADTSKRCVTLSIANPFPYTDTVYGKLNASCACTVGTFPLCEAPVVCALPLALNTQTNKCEAQRTCNASAQAENWGAGCSAPMTSVTGAEGGQSLVVSNTNALYSADSKRTYVCNGGAGLFELKSDSCELKPVQCIAGPGSVTWGAGCREALPLTIKGVNTKLAVTNEDLSYTPTSTASYTCQPNGSFTLDSGSICNAVQPPCTKPADVVKNLCQASDAPKPDGSFYWFSISPGMCDASGNAGYAADQVLGSSADCPSNAPPPAPPAPPLAVCPATNLSEVYQDNCFTQWWGYALPEIAVNDYRMILANYCGGSQIGADRRKTHYVGEAYCTASGWNIYLYPPSPQSDSGN